MARASQARLRPRQSSAAALQAHPQGALPGRATRRTQRCRWGAWRQGWPGWACWPSRSWSTAGGACERQKARPTPWTGTGHQARRPAAAASAQQRPTLLCCHQQAGPGRSPQRCWLRRRSPSPHAHAGKLHKAAETLQCARQEHQATLGKLDAAEKLLTDCQSEIETLKCAACASLAPGWPDTQLLPWCLRCVPSQGKLSCAFGTAS